MTMLLSPLMFPSLLSAVGVVSIPEGEWPWAWLPRDWYSHDVQHWAPITPEDTSGTFGTWESKGGSPQTISLHTLTKSFLCYRCLFKLRDHPPPPHLGKNPCSHSLTHPGLKHLHFGWLHIRYPWDLIYMWTVMLSIYIQIPALLLVGLRC